MSFRDEAAGDDLSELQSEAVPEEVRKWLASTFAKQETAPRRRGPDERPSFRSVANAIRTGIFIERIYRRMSSSQLMVIPPEVQHALKVQKIISDSLKKSQKWLPCATLQCYSSLLINKIDNFAALFS